MNPYNTNAVTAATDEMINPSCKTIDLGSWHRLFPGRLSLKHICHVRQEKVNVQGFRPTVDFHLFLGGKGFASIDGKTFQIRENTVAVFFPGSSIRHWSNTGWEVFWMDFDAKYVPVFREILDGLPPIWHLKSPENAVSRLNEIMQYSRKTYEYGFADRMDRMAENMIMECLLGREKHGNLKDSEFFKIIEYVEAHYCDFALAAILKKFGLSRPLLFQRWRRYISVPPGQYAMQLRINEACRLLTYSSMRINEIAQELNFKDPLYFSRKFRQFTGMNAVGYRKKYSSDNLGCKSVVPQGDGGRLGKTGLRH